MVALCGAVRCGVVRCVMHFYWLKQMVIESRRSKVGQLKSIWPLDVLVWWLMMCVCTIRMVYHWDIRKARAYRVSHRATFLISGELFVSAITHKLTNSRIYSNKCVYVLWRGHARCANAYHSPHTILRSITHAVPHIYNTGNIHTHSNILSLSLECKQHNWLLNGGI